MPSIGKFWRVGKFTKQAELSAANSAGFDVDSVLDVNVQTAGQFGFLKSPNKAAALATIKPSAGPTTTKPATVCVSSKAGVGSLALHIARFWARKPHALRSSACVSCSNRVPFMGSALSPSPLPTSPFEQW